MNPNTSESKPALLGTGLNGLVGSKLTLDYKDKYVFDSLDISDPKNPVDITQIDEVLEAFKNSSASHVVHLAAFTNVTAAWEQQGDKTGLAYKVNVDGTKNIIEACAKTNKKLIHISTAYVFDGKNEDMYLETDVMNPIEWYGHTKAWAEEAITGSDIDWTILRIDQPFRSDTFPKIDTAHRIIEGLKNNTLHPQFTDHWFGPTFIDDFVKVIDWVVRTNATGLYHATSGEKWTDFDFANALNQQLQLNAEVKPGKLADYLKTLDRPYQQNTALNASKLMAEIDFKIKSVEEAMAEIVV